MQINGGIMTGNVTLTALLAAAVTTGFLHTIAGPDHYLPFIAIAKSRNYGWFRTFLWTLVCGIGHVGSAILIAVLFLLLAKVFTKAQFSVIEKYRGDIAAYAMVGMGLALILHSLFCRWKNIPRRHSHVNADGSVTAHTHSLKEIHESRELSYWVVFIIFVLGPCEALLPLLTAASVLGAGSVILVAAVFSVTTIVTMTGAVFAGRCGLELLHFHFLEKFAPEAAGGTVMLCGLAILFLGW